MLLRPDQTFIDQATKQAERVFPRGTSWLTFESRFPAKEVFANSVLDPAIGIAGELGVKAFMAADWQNWISTTKLSLYELSTRVGVPPLKGTPLAQGMGTVYESIDKSIDTLRRYDDPAELVPALLKNAGLQVIQQLTSQGGMVAQTVAQVLAAAVWAVDVVATHMGSMLGKDVTMPPLQSEDPATDSWQVNRVLEVFRQPRSGGVAFPDGKVEPASNADYTKLYLPAYKPDNRWYIEHRDKGVAAQQGHPQESRAPGGAAQYRFDPGDASTFGFMPGTTTSLRVLQASYRFYASVRGTPVDRYTLRCKGVDKPCYKTTKAFDGSRDCRQCVKAESVWPTKGVGWAYGGAPLNATTPGENVGAFYPSTNKLLLNLLEAIAQPGPLLYTIDVERIYYQWKQSFEHFWEFAHSEWSRHQAPGWRGLVSRLATLMTAFESEGELRLGGRDPDMPLKLIANPREGEFGVPFSASIFSRFIAPFCEDLSRLQVRELDSLAVAYIPPGSGALYYENGKVRRNELGDRFVAARRELLNSNRRMLLDLRRVSDPEYRAELERAGVKPSPVNPLLQGSPGVEHELIAPKKKPRRPLPPPRISKVPPLLGVNKLVRLSPTLGKGRITVGTVGEQGKEAGEGEDASHTGVALGVAATGAVAIAAGILGMRKDEPPKR